jgi:hypothetical protein
VLSIVGFGDFRTQQKVLILGHGEDCAVNLVVDDFLTSNPNPVIVAAGISVECTQTQLKLPADLHDKCQHMFSVSPNPMRIKMLESQIRIFSLKRFKAITGKSEL